MGSCFPPDMATLLYVPGISAPFLAHPPSNHPIKSDTRSVTFSFLSFPLPRALSINGNGIGGRRRSHVVRMAPEEEKMTRRSPLDFPIEWDRPKPGRRPDIFPKFSPMKTPLPPPLPADPPEEEEEEEEEKKEEEEEDPDKEEPEKPKK